MCLINHGASEEFAPISFAWRAPVSHHNHIIKYLQDYWSFKCIFYVLIGYYRGRTRKKHEQGQIVTTMFAEHNEIHHYSKLSLIIQNDSEEIIDCVKIVLKCVYQRSSFSVYSSVFDSVRWAGCTYWCAGILPCCCTVESDFSFKIFFVD